MPRDVDLSDGLGSSSCHFTPPTFHQHQQPVRHWLRNAVSASCLNKNFLLRYSWSAPVSRVDFCYLSFRILRCLFLFFSRHFIKCPAALWLPTGTIPLARTICASLEPRDLDHGWRKMERANIRAGSTRILHNNCLIATGRLRNTSTVSRCITRLCMYLSIPTPV